jgi:hypothetical protein
VTFKQEVPALNLSIEQSTPNVPADGLYYVILNGEIVFRSKSRRKALDLYDARKEELFRVHGKPAPTQWDREEWLKEEQTRYDIQGMRSEWLRMHGSKSRKGGKGGRGGT